ncbi:hypothetical protein A4D02_13115 [Niastella koreensis]|uniref:DUF998 domain-containing protein n=2 Tax=Niastella koreensis TaxID=354356 RepID=G8TMB2_NIAKG|nr:DUF998 domain-containing protein [Niastella koreensis]AEW00894.1 hypothetical protein Niako_4637 [Niastella koreensis GR20-10]OQP42502.1 hypothetical protein A4D02_13115 [Niastella koreensis]
MTRKIFLICGILSSVLYVAANIICASQYDGYSTVSQTVSELSAIGTPTRQLWVTLMVPYSLLMIAFGLGVWQSAGINHRLRIVGIIFIVNSVIGFFWPPMHQREVLASGGGTLTDTLHIVFTIVTVPLMMLAIVFGAAALGKRFRLYSIITLVILIGAGAMTGIDGPKISANQPTPWIGIWERINIGIFLFWIVVLAIVLLRAEKREGSLIIDNNDARRKKVMLNEQPSKIKHTI